jgi:hypothetical protein
MNKFIIGRLKNINDQVFDLESIKPKLNINDDNYQLFTPIFSLSESIIEFIGKKVSFNYIIANNYERAILEFNNNKFKTLKGILDIKNIKINLDFDVINESRILIGNHDFKRDLSKYQGKFLLLQIKTN